MNWTALLLPAGIVAAFFTLAWLVKFPEQVWESITFRNRDGIKGHIVSVAQIIYMAGGIVALGWLVRKLLTGEAQ